MKRLFGLLAITIISSILLFSCEQRTSPLMNEKINRENLVEIADKMVDDKSISQEEITLFAAGLQRYTGQSDSLIGKTVGELIKEQKEMLRDQTAKNLSQNINNVRLRLYHEFRYNGIFIADDEQRGDFNRVDYQITNLGDKPIKEITGALQFFNGQNQLVKQFNISTINKEPIPPGESKDFQDLFAHRDSIPNDQMLRSPEMRFRAAWTPVKIEYTDGTVINLQRSGDVTPEKGKAEETE
jgi:hypothetical protein